MPTMHQDIRVYTQGPPRWGAVLLFTLAALHCTPEGPAPSELASAPVQPILSPSNPQIAQGTAQQFVVRSLLPSGRLQEVTTQVSWSVAGEDGERLPAPTDGLVELLHPGRYRVTAEYLGQRLESRIVVTDATLKSLELTPSAPQVAKGLNQQFKATASFSDGTTQDVTGMTAWSVKDTVGSGVASISSRGLAAGKKVGKARVSARYKTLSVSTTLTVTDATVVSLVLSPTSPTLAKGTTQSFAALASFSDGTAQDVSASADWAVTDVMGSGVASIDSLGAAVGLAEGQATVSAAYLDQVAETSLTVTPAVATGLLITPTSKTIVKGTTQQFVASAVLSDGSKQDVTMMAAWTASDVSGTAVASVDGGGLAKANAVGTANIKCQFRGFAASAVLWVAPAALTAVAITPTSATLAKGLAQTFGLVGTFSDGTTQNLNALALWSTSDLMGSDVASVSTAGTALGKNVGKAKISATYMGFTATAVLTVTAATLTRVVVSPATVAIAVAATQQYAAQGVYTDGATLDLTGLAAWSVTDLAPASGVASITAGGLLTAKSNGQAKVAAVYSGLRGEALLVVGGIKVASLYCSTDTNGIADVKAKLEGLHLFIGVDNVDMGSAAPSLMTLQQYSAVVVWADLSRGGCSYPSNIGNVLSQYVDAGGGVVVISPYYAGNSYSNIYSTSWDKYVVLESGGMAYYSKSSLGSADMTHPVLRGVAKVETNGSRCYQRAAASGTAIRSGASVIATWSDGNAMVVAGTPLGKPRVDINLYAFSSDIGSNGCYDSTSDVAKLLGNALLWVAGK